VFYSGEQLKSVFLKAKQQRFGIIASNVVFDCTIREYYRVMTSRNQTGFFK